VRISGIILTTTPTKTCDVVFDTKKGTQQMMRAKSTKRTKEAHTKGTIA